MENQVKWEHMLLNIKKKGKKIKYSQYLEGVDKYPKAGASSSFASQLPIWHYSLCHTLVPTHLHFRDQNPQWHDCEGRSDAVSLEPGHW